MPVLKLNPVCKDYIWGGTRLKTDYHKEFDGPRLAECWELSCHLDGPSVITNGVFTRRTLREYLAAVGKRVLGSNCQVFQEFPILIKFIDAKDNLFIQVHPNNTDALTQRLAVFGEDVNGDGRVVVQHFEQLQVLHSYAAL
ncbi:MAG: hypothetical protein LUE89_10755 [Clostridiales bacterium]|nr:hypothetical protein [Clostridiales bacterium]